MTYSTSSTNQLQPPVPHDPCLPQLAVALDAERMLGYLPSTDRLQSPPAMRIAYIRYKPATNCIVLYEIPQAGGLPLWVYAKLLAEQWPRHFSDPSGLSVYYPEHRMALSAFPSDLQMPSLRAVLDPRQTVGLMERLIPRRKRWQFAQGWGNWVPIRYKPERRCVIRGCYQDARTRSQRGFYARFYANSDVAETAQWHRHIVRLRAPGIKVPSCLGYDAKRRILLLRENKGTPLRELLLREAAATEAVEVIGRALAFWHRQPPPSSVAGRRSEREQLESAAEAVAHLSPRLLTGVFELASQLVQTIPRWDQDPALIHGDFYYDQVQLHIGKARFLDLDELAIGDPIEDLANFCAHLELLVLEDVMQESQVQFLRERFLEAYQTAANRVVSRNRLEWHLSASLLKLAVLPFRRFDPHWPDQIRHLVKLAQSAAGRM